MGKAALPQGEAHIDSADGYPAILVATMPSRKYVTMPAKALVAS